MPRQLRVPRRPSGGRPCRKPSAHHPSPDDGTLFATSLFDTSPASPPISVVDGAPGSPSASPTAAAPAIAPLPGVETPATCDYRAITTREDLEQLVPPSGSKPVIAVDTETIGLGHAAQLCGLSFAWHDRAGVYIPSARPKQASHLAPEEVLDILRPVLEDPALPKWRHNLKYDWLVLRHAGVELRASSSTP